MAVTTVSPIERVNDLIRRVSPTQVDAVVNLLEVMVEPAEGSAVELQLTPAEIKKVKQGIRELKTGQSKTWRDVKNELAR